MVNILVVLDHVIEHIMLIVQNRSCVNIGPWNINGLDPFCYIPLGHESYDDLIYHDILLVNGKYMGIDKILLHFCYRFSDNKYIIWFYVYINSRL